MRHEYDIEYNTITDKWSISGPYERETGWSVYEYNGVYQTNVVILPGIGKENAFTKGMAYINEVINLRKRLEKKPRASKKPSVRSITLHKGI